MTILGSWRVIATLSNEIPVYCKLCKQKVTFKETKEDEIYTRKCGCGCEILQYHEPDNFHITKYFTRKYISEKEFIKNYQNKNCLEQNGFRKLENGNYSRD
jgi:hypothetical protein